MYGYVNMENILCKKFWYLNLLFLQVQRIHNDALEITQNATAQSNLIQSKAKAASVATVENARSDGLQHLYSEIGITDQKQKAAFDYLRTIRAQDNIRLTVNYNQLVSLAGSLPGAG